MKNFDYKKEYADLYLPKKSPMMIDVASMNYVAVHGYGDPNEENGEYKQAVQVLYGISFTIKMSKKTDTPIDGYFEYCVPPLEGLWWKKDGSAIDFNHFSKKNFEWISMIRLPEFVDRQVFDWACTSFQKKHPDINLSNASFMTYEEGLCAQVMHIGAYDQEPQTITKLHAFIEEQSCTCDFDGQSISGQPRKHHEIYLGDPRRTKPENLKTLIRLPIKKR